MLLFDNEAGRIRELAGSDPKAGTGTGADTSKGALSFDVYNLYLPNGGKEVLTAPDTVPSGLKPEDAAKLGALLSSQVMQALSAVSLAKYLAPATTLNLKKGELAPVDLYVIVSDAAEKRTFDLLSFQARVRCWELLNLVYALACNWEDYPGDEGTRGQVQKLVDKALSWLPPKGSQTGDTWRNVVASIPTLVKAIKDAELQYMKAQLTTVGVKGGIGFLLSETNKPYDAVGWFGPVSCDPRVAIAGETTVVDLTTQKPVKQPTLVYPIPNIYMRTTGHNADLPGADKPMLTFIAQVPGLADYKPYTLYDHYGADAKAPANSNWNTVGDFIFGGGWDQLADEWTDSDTSVVKKVVWKPDPSKLPPDKKDPQNMLADFLHHQWNRLGGTPFVDAKQYQTQMNEQTKSLYSETILGGLIWTGLYYDPEFSSTYGGDAKSPHQVADEIIPKIRAAHDAKRLELMRSSVYAKMDVTNPDKPAYPVVAETGGVWAQVFDARAALSAAIEFVCFLPPMELGWTYEPYKNEHGVVVNDVAPKPTLLINKWYFEVFKTKAYENFKARVAQVNKDCLGTSTDKFDAEKLVGMMATWPVESIAVPTYSKLQLSLATMKGDRAVSLPRFSDLSPSFAKLYSWQPTKDKLPFPLAFKLVPETVLKLHTQAKDACLPLTAALNDAQKAYVKARSEVKAQLLLSMMSSQLATEAQALTDDMIAALADMAKELYGCSIPDAPKSLTDPQKVLDYYKQQLTDCAKNPQPGSVAYKLNELLVQYAKLKALADGGDANAAAALNAVSAQISELQAKMASLAALRGARRNRALDNTTDKGGTLSNLSLSAGLLGVVLKAEGDAINVTLDNGSTVKIPLLSGVDKKAADDTASQNEETKHKADASSSYIAGSGEALQSLLSSYNLPIPPAVTETIKVNEQVATSLVVPKKESGNLWLWLILGGAVAYSQSKK